MYIKNTYYITDTINENRLYTNIIYYIMYAFLLIKLIYSVCFECCVYQEKINNK